MKYIKRKSALKPISGNIVDTFNINNKTTNAPSLRLMIDLIYPVGRGFMDFTDTDYSNYLGCTWERELVGMTPIGKNANDTDFATVGKTGGEKSHTLTLNEMPSHNHDIVYTDANYPQSTKKNSVSTLGWGSNWRGVGDVILEKGSNQAHNNLPPYQVVSYWKRVA